MSFNSLCPEKSTILSLLLMESKYEQTQGIMKRVRIVAKAKPKEIATAIGFQSLVDSAVERIIGKKPPIEVTVVKIMGLNLIAPAEMMDSQR